MCLCLWEQCSAHRVHIYTEFFICSCGYEVHIVGIRNLIWIRQSSIFSLNHWAISAAPGVTMMTFHLIFVVALCSKDWKSHYSVWIWRTHFQWQPGTILSNETESSALSKGKIRAGWSQHRQCRVRKLFS